LHAGDGDRIVRRVTLKELRWMMRLFATVLLAAALQPGPAHSGFDDLSGAVAYCRNYRKMVKLNDDQNVLCFDGEISKEQGDALFRGLAQGGFFVVRSTGGYAPAAIRLANILRDKDATVVIYDYCFSACANFFFVASAATFVMKRTIVAWHGTGTRAYCTGDTIGIVGRGRHESRRLSDRTPELRERCVAIQQMDRFFTQRAIDDRHVYEPQPSDIRQLFESAVGQGEPGKSIFWMWHPRNYGNYFRIPITYESYPASQEEVDEILSKLGLRNRVIFDPPMSPER
jgi:hypothetical protein